jgi:hypothetical protein
LIAKVVLLRENYTIFTLVGSNEKSNSLDKVAFRSAKGRASPSPRPTSPAFREGPPSHKIHGRRSAVSPVEEVEAGMREKIYIIGIGDDGLEGLTPPPGS